MSDQVFRSILEPIRVGLSWDALWKEDDRGLILCWEIGRVLGENDPELALRARRGELPVLGWKGGIDKRTKKKEKYGTLYYLAQWQGLRGEDLAIRLNQEPEIVCTKTGIRVVFTFDLDKYGSI